MTATEGAAEVVAADVGDFFSGGLFSRVVDRFDPTIMVALDKKRPGLSGRTERRLFAGNVWARRMAVSELAAKFSEEQGDAALAEADGIAFLQWILDNWESIYKIIQAIMALFAT